MSDDKPMILREVEENVARGHANHMDVCVTAVERGHSDLLTTADACWAERVLLLQRENEALKEKLERLRARS